MKIEIAVDNIEAKAFSAWLREQGHEATVGNSTGNYVDGVWTSADENANDIFSELWDSYCTDEEAIHE